MSEGQASSNSYTTSIDFGIDKSKTYAVAMSGGVDSSTTAAIIKDSGAKLFGVTLYLHEYSVPAIDDAKKICDFLGIDHYVIDAREKFGPEIIDKFYESYASGITPNPCAICNRDIKFGEMLKFCVDKNADYLATGHYASCLYKDGQCWLKDIGNSKDQTYFLSMVNRNNLKYAYFPLARVRDKNQTREIARHFGMSFFDKVSESQDICFLSGVNYKEELRKRVTMQPGNIIKKDLGVIGTHDGVGNYTIGQRRGMSLSWGGKPLYIVEINKDTNEIVVDEVREPSKIQLNITNVDYLLDVKDEFECWFKPRYRIQKIRCSVKKHGSNASITCIHHPTIIAPGQVCVMYNDDGYVIGGGEISR